MLTYAPPTPNRLLQDLTWAVRSPGLLQPESSDVTWPGDDWFLGQPITAGNIPIPRHPENFRLGLHFEALIAHWLEMRPEFNIRAANLQVQGAERTLGEFDLIVDTPAGLEHWELAVKFYLGTGDCSSPRDFYGPNTRDRLDLKLARMQHHQLALGKQPEGLQLLEALDLVPTGIRSLVKGRLFYPWARYHDPLVTLLASTLNPAHERGWWVAEADLDPNCFVRTGVLPKQYWLDTFTSPYPDTVLDFAQLQDYLAAPETGLATHVVLLTDEGLERSRGFILKSGWFDEISRHHPPS